MALDRSRRIGERQCIVFGTADAMRCVTVTANDKFVRAAAEQGVMVAAHLIAARALTGRKRLGLDDLPEADGTPPNNSE